MGLRGIAPRFHLMFFVEEQKILETGFAQNSMHIESIELIVRKQTIHRDSRAGQIALRVAA